MLDLTGAGDRVEGNVAKGGLGREGFPKRGGQNLINAAEGGDDVDNPKMGAASPLMGGQAAYPAVQALMDFIRHPGPVDEGERHGALGEDPALIEHDGGKYGCLDIGDEHVFPVFSARHQPDDGAQDWQAAERLFGSLKSGDGVIFTHERPFRRCRLTDNSLAFPREESNVAYLGVGLNPGGHAVDIRRW